MPHQLYVAAKFATNGCGTTIVLSSSAKSNTYALYVSGLTTRHAIAPNGSMRFLLLDRTQQYTNDYSRRSHQPPDHTALTCPRPSPASISCHILPPDYQAQRLLNISPWTPDCKQRRDQRPPHKIPVPSNLKIPAWTQRLTSYPNTRLCDFLEFRWPIGYVESALPT